MGLYGYVGYLANPRATQEVDILVSEDEIEQVIEAICKRWPQRLDTGPHIAERTRRPSLSRRRQRTP